VKTSKFRNLLNMANAPAPVTGISETIRQLRAANKGKYKWKSHGKRTLLMEALLRQKGLI